jgi:hypothetical protein
MIKLTSLVASIFLACAAQAASIDSLTLTPSGPNSVFTISGTYPPDIATTAYSFANTPYTLAFGLPTTPTSLAFVDTTDGVFGINTTVTVNNVAFLNSQIAFFDASQGGGLDVCLSEECGFGPPASNYRWVVFGDTVFSGDVSNPTFNSGVAGVDSTQSFIESPVPEPSALALTAAAMVALTLCRARKTSPL